MIGAVLMKHDSLNEDLRELAALYALDLLEGEEREQFESHLALGCGVCQNEVDEIRATSGAVLAEDLPALYEDVPAGLKRRVMQAAAGAEATQAWRAWNGDDSAGLHVVRSGEGEWESVRDGIEVKKLYVDQAADRITMLIRMAPGTAYVPHRHAGPEQCLVLDGDLHEGDLVVRQGDYQCVAEGTVHGAQWTENGCLLLIVCSQRDELIT